MATPIEPGSVQGGDGNTPGPNPAWNDVLSQVPQEYHSILTENFSKWDQSAQQRVESANSEAKKYEPYKPFLENDITPEEIQEGLRLVYEITANPQNVWEALGKAYNLTPAQVQQVANGQIPQNQPGQNPQVPNASQTQAQQFDDPRFKTLQDGIELVSQVLLQDQQAKQAALEDKKLDDEIHGLEEKYGKFDEKYVIAMMMQGMEGEDAVKAFRSLQSQIANDSSMFAPKIIGSTSGGGSGYPSNAIDPTKLDGKATRNLVAQMLDAANRQP